MLNPKTLAEELIAAYAQRRADVIPPSAREGGIDLDTAYEVERELVQRRRTAGYKPVGLKVGFANRAMWRALKLDTLVWASMYEDTVRLSTRGPTVLPISRMVAPKIEPEIVFKLKHAPAGDTSDPAAVLKAVEWLALGFEIIDCVYADWKFQPVDFVASYGLHAALIIGEPHHVRAEEIPELVAQLASFKLTLLKGEQAVAEGFGKNSLKSPALCVGELAAAVARRSSSKRLGPGDLISSGTLTEAQLLAPGQKWRVVVEGLPVPEISASIVG
jgi:2-oxo-3-hexenedioate decarboxylase